MDDSFSRLRIDDSRWLLPLSGGYDSRSILLFLTKNGYKPKAITWGLESFRGVAQTDAGVAKALSDHFGLEHEFLPIHNDACPIQEAMDRFVTLSEGRTDGVEAYWDGFGVWKQIFEFGVCGVIRGEQAFGEPPVYTETDVRIDRVLGLFEDYTNLKDAAAWGLEPPVLPERLRRRDGESLATWRDRLYHQHTMPVTFSALNELKACYVETLDPLDTRRIVDTIRTLPDRWRDDKTLFRRLVESLTPPIGFPKGPVVPHPWDVMRTRPVVEHLREELDTDHARGLMSEEMVRAILGKVHGIHETPPRRKRTLLSRLRRLVPTRIRRALRQSVVKPELDWNVLAFRAYVASRTARVLADDAAALEPPQ
jgi:hypothetical protein